MRKRSFTTVIRAISGGADNHPAHSEPANRPCHAQTQPSHCPAQTQPSHWSGADEKKKFHDGHPSHLLALRTIIQLTLSQTQGVNPNDNSTYPRQQAPSG